MTAIYIMCALIVLIIYMRLEASWVQVVNVDISSKGHKGLKILQLSDIHMDHLAVPRRRILKIIAAQRPDLIVLTGDYFEYSSQESSFMLFHKLITRYAPSVACLGNHDYKAFQHQRDKLKKFISGLESAGTKVLLNSSFYMKKNGVKYCFTGIDDIRSGKPDIAKALASIPPDTDIRICISHNPDLVLYLPEGAFDYMISGHFHGGQIWAPFNLEYKILRKDKLCKQGIKKGLHIINSIKVYINRGLGGVFVPLRFLSRPEITVFNI